MKTSLLTIGLVWLSAACSANGSGNGFNRDTGTTSDATVDGSGGHDTGTNPVDVYSSLCGSSPSTISGRVFAPNGVDPLPGVQISVTSNTATFPPADTMVQCSTCATSSILSGPDGSFQIIGGQLDAGGTFTVVFQSGAFRHVQRNVVVPMCGSVTLTASQSSLPGAPSGDDTVPRIAVGSSTTSSRDANDHFTTVLDAIGITAYDRLDPDKAGTSSANDLIGLFSNMSLLQQYQIVAAPCGSLGNFTVAANLTPTMVTNLQTWLGMGGRLYASDLAYSIIDKAYPGGITFANGTSTHAGADPADIGQGFTGAAATTTPIVGTVVDTDLLAWLRSVNVLSASENTMNLYEFRNPWGAMDSVPDAELSGRTGPSGVVLVQGNVSWTNGMMGVHPLTAMVDYAAPSGASCGRVVFSSYHVQSALPDGGATAGLTSQERILEYLFFRLSTCIQVPG